MINSFRKIKDWLLDLIFPRECLGCGREQTWLCQDCFNQIKIRAEQSCVVCHHSNITGKTCSACKKDNSIDYVWVASYYEDKRVADLITKLKYNFVEEIGLSLSVLLNKFLKESKLLDLANISKDDLILTIVPLNKKRFLERGFNQNFFIAKQLSGKFNLDFKPELLIRQRNTLSQAKLDRTQRLENLKDSFILNEGGNLNNKNIIIVDDVVTTGSTLAECAKVLKQNGAAKIIGLVIAKN